MLGKLIKHEWKSTYKFPLILNIFIGILTLIGCLSFHAPFWRQLLTADTLPSFSFFDFLSIVFLIVYYVAIIVASFGITIYFAIRYFKTMYTDEGYLTHTLPVSAKQLVLSKAIISIIWHLINVIIVFASMYVLIYSMFKNLVPTEYWNEVTDVIHSYIPALADAFKASTGISFTTFAALMVLFIIASSFSGTFTVYFCISIGQLFKKHKLVASILTYLVYSTVLQIAVSLVALPITMHKALSVNYMDVSDPIAVSMSSLTASIPTFYVSAAIAVIGSIAFYFISEYIARRKLNLD